MKNSNYNIIFLDTETTGNEEKDRLCQLAFKRPEDSINSMFCQLFKPPVPISIESMAVHHITPKMVESKPEFKNSNFYLELKSLLENETTILVAHNAPFDKGILIKEDVHPTLCIDTLKLVRHFDPDMIMTRHNLQFLRYFLKLDEDIDFPIVAHDAKSDVIILELLFKRLFTKTQKLFNLYKLNETYEKMIELSTQPAFIGKFAFGKYLGFSIYEVAKIDSQYLVWLLNNKRKSDQDEADWIFTLEKVLGII